MTVNYYLLVRILFHRKHSSVFETSNEFLKELATKISKKNLYQIGISHYIVVF